jgi:hypothetical protein
LTADTATPEEDDDAANGAAGEPEAAGVDEDAPPRPYSLPGRPLNRISPLHLHDSRTPPRLASKFNKLVLPNTNTAESKGQIATEAEA